MIELKFFQENMDFFFFLEDELQIFFFWYNFFYFSITTLSEWVSEWSRSVVYNSAIPWTVAYHAPLSMGFSRQEYWSGLPFPSPEDLRNPGTEPRSPALRSNTHYIIQSVQLNGFSCIHSSLVALTVKNPPTMKENWVQPLGWEDPLEEGLATQSSVLAWRSTMDRGAWWATAHGFAESDATKQQLYIHHNNQLFIFNIP